MSEVGVCAQRLRQWFDRACSARQTLAAGPSAGVFSAALERRAVSFLLLAVAVNGLCWSFVVPFDGAPDEIAHYEIVRFMAQHHRLPVFGQGKDLYIRSDPAATFGKVIGVHATRPFGPYLVGAALLSLSGAEDDYSQYHLARLPSVLYTVITTYFAYLVARRLFRRELMVVIGVPITVGLIPQATYVGSYVNEDAFTIVASTIVLYLVVRGMQEGWPLRDSVVLGGSLCLAAFSKINGWLVVFPAVAIALVFSLRGNRRQVIVRLIMILAAPFALLGWWLSRNYLLYGDVLALAVFKQAWPVFVADWDPNWKPLVEMGYNFVSMLTDTPWLRLFFQSLWGVFGYMDIFLHSAFYWALLCLCVASGLALLGRLVQKALSGTLSRSSLQIRVLCIFALTIAILLVASIYTSLYNDFQPQGRYLFPALVPICVFLVLGFRELSAFVGLRHWSIPALGAGLAVLNLTSLVFYVIPAFYR